nr:low temperature requirement protein A [Micromonospora provocatoris]
MARDAYAYLFLPMIAGIILFALGAETIVHGIADPNVPPSEPAHGPGVPLLFGGVICYLCGNMLFQLRTLRTVSWTRVGAVLLLGVTIPVAERVPGLAALGILTTITVGMVAAEVIVFAEGRQALRKLVFEERTSHEAHEAAWRARWHEQPEDRGENG